MSILRRTTNGFIKIFGDIKVFKWPLFIVYDPASYKVKGKDTRQVLDLVQPGDILLRGYDNYLDGFFIPGYFSHVGLYVGEVKPEHGAGITVPGGKRLFATGPQMVVHAMAEGVFVQDILDFCRTDRMLILRFPQNLSARLMMDPSDVPFNRFTEDEKKLFMELVSGKTLSFDRIFDVLFQLALSQVGKKYDFSFNFKNYNNLSCTEFLYFCIKSLEPYHLLAPVQKKFLFYQKRVVVPDAFIKAGLELVWQSPSVDKYRLKQLKEA